MLFYIYGLSTIHERNKQTTQTNRQTNRQTDRPRNGNSNCLPAMSSKTKFGDRAFSVVGPVVWNSLPASSSS